MGDSEIDMLRAYNCVVGPGQLAGVRPAAARVASDEVVPAAPAPHPCYRDCAEPPLQLRQLNAGQVARSSQRGANASHAALLVVSLGTA
jgi:hypothetical protein